MHPEHAKGGFATPVVPSKASPPCVQVLKLAGGSVTPIEDGLGLSVHCQAGTIWVTQENDRRDIVLAPGQSFALDRRGRALLYALGDAWACLEGEHRGARRGASWGIPADGSKDAPSTHDPSARGGRARAPEEAAIASGRARQRACA